MDTPLSQSSVTLKLELIQRRCAELSAAPEELLELALEDAPVGAGDSDPYNRSKA